MKHSFALAALLIAALAAPAWAIPPLTLAEAIDRAVAHNPRLKAVERAIEAARAREVEAAAGPNPNVSLVVDQVPFNNPIAGNFLAGVTQPLLPPGQREARMGLAKVETELAGLTLDAERLALVAQVQRGFAQLLYTRDMLVEAREDAGVAAQLLDATRARFKAGEVARVELLRAEVEHSRLARAVAMAEAREAQARGRLNVLLGASAQASLEVATLPVPKPRALPSVSTFLTTGWARRPELRQAEAVIARENFQRQVAATALWTGTEVSVTGGAVAGSPGVSTSLAMPIPIYRQQGGIAEAEANRARAEAERDALKNTISLEIEEAYREAAIAADQVDLFRRLYLPQAEQLADNARRRFAAGEGNGVDVIEALRTLHETHAAYAQAVLDYRVAETELARASGQALAARPSQETTP
jgi:cobalt-zinc-cadmium efflux system outer membrane protein